jgi:aspartate dehydrogenase
MIMSVGGLVGSDQIFRWIKKSRGTLIVPSGAICGLDGLKAASLGKIRSVTLRTSKPPRALGVTAVKKPRPIFKGNALQAIRRYPQNINVSCILSLAGIGAKKTRVEIICNPHLKRNVHEVEIVGDFGRLVTRSENVPSKANPKTSQLAILSAVATLKQYLDHFQIGT